MTDTTAMNITMGTEFALNLHFTTVATYTDIEKALVDAGIESYAILRWVNPDDSCDVQITVRSAVEGNQLDATDTLQKLAEAVGAIVDAEEEPTE